MPPDDPHAHAKKLTEDLTSAMLPALAQGLHASQEASAWDGFVQAAIEAGQPAGVAVHTADMVLEARRVRFTPEGARAAATIGRGGTLHALPMPLPPEEEDREPEVPYPGMEPAQ